jgi:type VI secretion system protein ImpK
MHEQLANVVYPVLRQGLRLQERLARGETLDLVQEQAKLRGLLNAETLGGDGGRSTDGEQFLGMRYALVCWLDEIFTLHSSWEAEWEEHSLEFSLYGARERAYRFWQQVRIAEARRQADALEVYFLCAMLGFRGELHNKPDELRARRDALASQIAQARAEWQRPPELPAPVNVPQLLGARRKQRMLLAAAASLLVLTPVIVFYLVQWLGGG